MTDPWEDLLGPIAEERTCMNCGERFRTDAPGASYWCCSRECGRKATERLRGRSRLSAADDTARPPEAPGRSPEGIRDVPNTQDGPMARPTDMKSFWQAASFTEEQAREIVETFYRRYPQLRGLGWYDSSSDQVRIRPPSTDGEPDRRLHWNPRRPDEFEVERLAPAPRVPGPADPPPTEIDLDTDIARGLAGFYDETDEQRR